jgi:hypothetical protein
MSWWNSLETVTSVWQMARVLVVGCIALSLLVAAVDLVVGRRVDTLRDRARADQERAWQQQIGLAQAEANEASAQAAKKASEQAGANVLTRSKLSAEAAKQPSQPIPAAATVAPGRARGLSPDQQREFRELVGPQLKGDVEVQITAGDAEAQQFAAEIGQLLQSAGWTIQHQSSAVFSPAPTGLILQVRDRDQQPMYAGVLQRALDKIGIAARGGYNPDVPPGVTRLIVGRKG